MMSMKNTREQTFNALEMIAQRKYWITIKIERWDVYGKSYIISGKCPHLFIKHIWNASGSSHAHTAVRYHNHLITQISNGFDFSLPRRSGNSTAKWTLSETNDVPIF